MPPRSRGGINRFVVMAMLQSARARRLGLAPASAHSWGLNRAIFYAAAKRGFSGSSPKTGDPVADRSRPDMYRLGEDAAYCDPTAKELAFTIGGKTQTEAEFQLKIAVRFGPIENFASAERAADEIVAAYDDRTLGSPGEFYATVYKPRRDQLVADWTAHYAPAPVPPAPVPPRQGLQGV